MPASRVWAYEVLVIISLPIVTILQHSQTFTHKRHSKTTWVDKPVAERTLLRLCNCYETNWPHYWPTNCIIRTTTITCKSGFAVFMANNLTTPRLPKWLASVCSLSSLFLSVSHSPLPAFHFASDLAPNDQAIEQIHQKLSNMCSPPDNLGAYRWCFQFKLRLVQKILLKSHLLDYLSSVNFELYLNNAARGEKRDRVNCWWD